MSPPDWQWKIFHGKQLLRKYSERINLTPGASYGLMNTLQQCTSPGTGYTKQAFIVSPAYFLAAKVFEGDQPYLS